MFRTDGSTRCRGALAALLLALAAGVAPAADWNDFAHPATPHPGAHKGPISIPELITDHGKVIDLPVLVVLLSFRDMQPQTVHTAAFFEDLVFGTGSGLWTSGCDRPSVKQIIEESTNQRLRLVPAQETHGTHNDGVVGWIDAQCPPGVTPPPDCDTFAYYFADIGAKRAEGIRRADPFVNYAAYDVRDKDWNYVKDGLITSNDLVVMVVNADDYCLDQHDSCGHPDPGPDNCAGGNCRFTNPGDVPVDGVHVRQLVAGMIETAHANVFAHELGHQVFGLGDLYQRDGGNPRVTAEDGYYVYDPTSCGTDCWKAFDDDCADAACLADVDTRASGSTVNATGTDVSTCAFADELDVWYTYTPAASGTVDFELCGYAGFDVTLSIFNSCGGSELPGGCSNDWVPADCNGDGTSNGYRTRLSPNLTAGQTYYLRVSGYNEQTGKYWLDASGGGAICDNLTKRWHPPDTSLYSLMGNYPDGYVVHFDPWAKVHLGFVQPSVIDADGVYTVHDAETSRSIATQSLEPEALVIYDPLRLDPYQEYFVLENRTIARVDGTPADAAGLAVWLINENPMPDETTMAERRAVRLVRRGGHWASWRAALWDGSNATDGYDLTAFSTPRDTGWTNRSLRSYVDVLDISPAGDEITVRVHMPPIFSDVAYVGVERGSQDQPYDTLGEALTAIPSPPRTIRLAGGNYDEQLTIKKPCMLMRWKGGKVFVGRP
jgi:M6 family metalloprotease-like protein